MNQTRLNTYIYFLCSNYCVLALRDMNTTAPRVVPYLFQPHIHYNHALLLNHKTCLPFANSHIILAYFSAPLRKPLILQLKSPPPQIQKGKQTDNAKITNNIFFG